MFLLCFLLTKLAFSGDGFTLDPTKTTLTITDAKAIADTEESQFKAITSIQTVIINNGITHIGNNAFNGVASITELGVPESLVTIGDKAFMGCRLLTELNLNEGTTTIGSMAFKNCDSLEIVRIPGTATIKPDAFEGCTIIHDLTLLKGHKMNIRAIFKDCYKRITHVVIDGQISELPSEAFKDLPIESYRIPSSVTKIGDNAFDGCNKLKKLEYFGTGNFENKNIGKVPSDLEITVDFTNYQNNKFGNIDVIKSGIDSDQFHFTFNTKTNVLIIQGNGVMSDAVAEQSVYTKCTGVKEIIIDNAITHIGANCFNAIASLEKVTLAKSIETFGNDAFKGCINIKEVTIVGTASGGVFKDSTKLQKVNILGSSVLAISGTFASAKGSIQEVILSNEITTLPASTFAELSNLKSVTLPSSIATKEGFGTTLFTGCSKLIEIHYYGDVKDLTDLDLGTDPAQSTNVYVKRGFTGKFGSITPTQVDVIDNLLWVADSGKTTLEIKMIPNILGLDGKIADYGSNPESPFKSFADLQTVTIGEGVTEIGNNLFNGLTKLKTITLPSTLKRIGDSAFLGCTELSNFNFPEGLTSIEASAFKQCQKLTTVNIPLDTTVGSNAFNQCTELTDVILSLTKVDDEAFTLCEKIKTVTIKSNDKPAAINDLNKPIKVQFPGSVEVIETVNINEGIEEISASAFKGLTKITSIVLPESVKKIGKDAFSGCTRLEKITYNGNVDFGDKQLAIPENTKVIVTDIYKNTKFGEKTTEKDGTTEGGSSGGNTEGGGSSGKPEEGGSGGNTEGGGSSGKPEGGGSGGNTEGGGSSGKPEGGGSGGNTEGGGSGGNEDGQKEGNEGSKLGGGEIAGIVIGVVAAVAIIGFCIYWFALRKKTLKVSEANNENEDKKDKDEYYVP